MVHNSDQIKYKVFGFTLVELLVVVGLLGILLTVGLTSYAASLKNARDARRKTDLESIKQALELYRSDNSPAGYPDGDDITETSLKTVLTSPVPYFNQTTFPKDPQSAQGKAYYYARTSEYTYNLCTFLENASGNTCLGSYDCDTVQSGTQACNYGITQP